jgi:type II secretory pathway pseudopilin PulG
MRSSMMSDVDCRICADEKGLTLLEIIVSIILASIMGAMLVQFMGTSMIKSAKPLARLQQNLTLNDIMENITADYKKLLMDNSTPIATLKGYIDSGNVVGNTPYYGNYTPTTNYILFNGGNETNDGGGTNRLLKVTLTSGDQSISCLFTK